MKTKIHNIININDIISYSVSIIDFLKENHKEIKIGAAGDIKSVFTKGTIYDIKEVVHNEFKNFITIAFNIYNDNSNGKVVILSIDKDHNDSLENLSLGNIKDIEITDLELE